ncbi:MAG: hypothetical protein ACREDR_31665, partial [Blastocatellia bacterium]
MPRNINGDAFAWIALAAQIQCAEQLFSLALLTRSSHSLFSLALLVALLSRHLTAAHPLRYLQSALY